MKIGDIFHSGPTEPSHLVVKTPLRVIGKATKEQLMAQRKLALQWQVDGILLYTNGKYFYRVEAAD